MTTATLTAESGWESTAPMRHKKFWVSWAFKKAVDMGARAALTNTIKIVAATTLVGAGASSILTIGVTAAATGIGAAAYSYLKDYAVAKYKGEDVNFWDKSRLKKAKWALLAGVAGGAFGSWLAGTDAFQSVLSFAKDYGFKALVRLTDVFSAAHAAPLATLAPAAVILPAVEVSVKQPDVLGKLWAMVSKSDQANGKLIVQMMRIEPDTVDSVSPQYLKDRAHDILRLKDIPWEDRLKLAKDLATESQARGNKQAVQFLKDLVKLEKLGGLPTAKIVTLPEAMTLSEVRVSAPRVSVDELVIVEIPEQLPVKTVLIEHDAVTGETTERIVDAVQGEGLVFEPMRDFREAALCMVSAPDADGVYDADCQTFKDDMEPGDYVTFAGNGAMDTTVLTEDSVGVKTKDFLHQKVIADGVQKLSLHPAVLPAASLMP